MSNPPSPPPPRPSSFSYYITNKSDKTTHVNRSERPVLPPIASMKTGFTSRSWPPPSTLSTTKTNIIVQEISSSNGINISPIQHQRSNQELWSSIPNINENSGHHTNRLDYFISAPSSSSSHTLPTIDQHHHRQKSVPQLPALTSDAPQHNTNSRNTSIELVLTPSLSASSFRTIERDIEQVIQHCNSLATNMTEKKQSIVENDHSFTKPTTVRPWLDDMISKGNEVLNALLRLRKHQLAAEYAELHRVPDRVAENSPGGQYQESEGYSLLNNSSVNVLSLNTAGRLRKRGRPVFQGRCHSCNISETPEWRRGPDGARTLCNACGLHYAKLAKRKNPDKQSQTDVKKETPEYDRDDTSMK